MNARDSSLVAIVDDDAAIREAVVFVLESVGIRVVGFDSASSFLASPGAAACACLIMDVRMPGLSGIEAHRRLLDAGRKIPVIFITGHGDVEMAVGAMKLGAVDFLAKPFRDQALIDAVQTALSRHAADETAAAPAGIDREIVAQRFNSLTPREREVMALVLRGLRSKQIAADLDISQKTVEEYRSRILQKMGVASSCELVSLVAGANISLPGGHCSQ